MAVDRAELRAKPPRNALANRLAFMKVADDWSLAPEIQLGMTGANGIYLSLSMDNRF